MKISTASNSTASVSLAIVYLDLRCPRPPRPCRARNLSAGQRLELLSLIKAKDFSHEKMIMKAASSGMQLT